jgi:hypothetical protein
MSKSFILDLNMLIQTKYKSSSPPPYSNEKKNDIETSRLWRQDYGFLRK